jgi:hypothetical protein
VSPPVHVLRPLAEVAAAAPPPGLGEISLGERSLAWVGSAIDGAAVGAARLLVRTLFSGAAGEVERWRRSAEPFLDGPWSTDPARFLLDDDALPTLLHAAAMRRRPIAGGEIVTRRLTMLHRRAPADEPDGATFATPGDAILLEHWQHTGRAPLATAIALHGFGMGNPRFDAFALHAGALFRRGLDVALLTLPHHGGRAGRGARFSGEGFVTLDVGALNASLRAAIGEARVVRRWLRDSAAAPVGFLGLSLGGYVAATIAALEEDLAFAIAIAPPVCIGDLAWHFAGDAAGGRGPESASFDRDVLRAAYRVHSPLTYPLRAPRERLLIVAGAGDRVVPPEHPQALWAHWERPAIEWFGGSHLAPFGRAKIASAAIGHLRRLGIV